MLTRSDTPSSPETECSCGPRRNRHRIRAGATAAEVDGTHASDSGAFHDRLDRDRVRLRSARVPVPDSALSRASDGGSWPPPSSSRWARSSPASDRGCGCRSKRARCARFCACTWRWARSFSVCWSRWASGAASCGRPGAGVTGWYLAAMAGVILVMAVQGYLGGELVYRYGAEVKFRYRKLAGRSRALSAIAD